MTVRDRALSRYDNSQNLQHQAAFAAWNDLTVSGSDGRQRTIELPLWSSADKPTTDIATAVGPAAPPPGAISAVAGEPDAVAPPAPLASADSRALAGEIEAVLAQAVALAPPAQALALDHFSDSADTPTAQREPTAPVNHAADA